MKFDMKEVLKPAALLCAICLLVTALLVGTNMMTEGKIAQNAVEKAEATRRVVLPAATDFELEEDCAVGYANGEIVGYVFTTDCLEIFFCTMSLCILNTSQRQCI